MSTQGRSGTRGLGTRVAAVLLTGLSIAAAAGVATADRAEAAQCPAGTVAFGILCIRTGTPTVTAPPQTTTTTAPILALPPVTVPPVLTPPPAPAPMSGPDAARHLLALLNGERGRAGLGVLAWRDDVAAIALAHSERMAQAGDIFHSDSFFGSTVKSLLNVVARGENVAYNGDVDAAHARLMASPGHRANILDARFSVVGIGVVRAADGRYFITQDFVQPAGAPRSAAPRSTAPAASRAAAPRPAAKPAPAPVTTTTTAAPAPITTAPAPTVPEVAPGPPLLAAAPTPIAATGRPVPSDRPLAAAALVLLGLVSVGCWLLPRRRS